MRYILSTFLIALLASSGAYACVITEDERLHIFDTLDRDKDGQLSQVEYVEGESVRINKTAPEDIRQLEYRFTKEMAYGYIPKRKFVPINLKRCL